MRSKPVRNSVIGVISAVVVFVFTFAVMAVSVLSIISSQYDEKKYQNLEAMVQKNFITQGKIELENMPENMGIMMTEDKKLKITESDQSLFYIVVDPETLQITHNYNNVNDLINQYIMRVTIFSLILAGVLAGSYYKILQNSGKKNKKSTKRVNREHKSSTMYKGKINVDDAIGGSENEI